MVKRTFYFSQALFFNRDNVCPYCLQRRFKVVHRKAFLIKICRCADCGLYWTNPIFRLHYFYESLYEDGPELAFVPLNGEKLDMVKKNLFKGSGRDYEYFISWMSSILGGKRLLEFGSSWGYFLYQAEQKGFNVTGVEISAGRRKSGIERFGVRIVPNLDSLIGAKEKFNGIVTFHTLEHLVDIHDIFAKFRQLLVSGGKLLITAPFLPDNPDKKGFSVMGAVHPLGFTRDFFMRNLPLEGFKVEFRNWLVICERR